MFFLQDVAFCTDPDGLGKIIAFLKTVLYLIQRAIPIILIFYGSLDLGKAVMAGKEDEIQKAQQLLLKRVIAAVLVFFITAIVTFAMGLVGDEGSHWRNCWNAKRATIVTE
jgi:hypothetical protein